MNFSDKGICEKLSNYGWTSLQQSFCKRNFDFAETLKKAAKLTLDECQSQFKSRRWNCSISNDKKRIFGKLPESGLREASFIYALSSAALTYTITNACSEGKIMGCSCDETKKGISSDGNRWSGCSDNIAYGMGVSEIFLEPQVKHRYKLTHLNMHNYETGRQIIEQNMVKQCKCHGVSGSCEIKTCWRAMPSFNLIASKLKNKYDAAIKVQVRRVDRKVKIIPQNRYYRSEPIKKDLIFLNKSPDYCQTHNNLASYGTKGRICNKTSRGIDSCNLLCCGRPYKTVQETVKYKCNCTFVWCCSVNCQECQTVNQVTRCV